MNAFVCKHSFKVTPCDWQLRSSPPARLSGTGEDVDAAVTADRRGHGGCDTTVVRSAGASSFALSATELQALLDRGYEPVVAYERDSISVKVDFRVEGTAGSKDVERDEAKGEKVGIPLASSHFISSVGRKNTAESINALLISNNTAHRAMAGRARALHRPRTPRAHRPPPSCVARGKLWCVLVLVIALVR